MLKGMVLAVQKTLTADRETRIAEHATELSGSDAHPRAQQSSTYC